ncbi:MAG: Arc family DNA-binding protein [Dehalococcoidia bacterium]
MKRLTIRNVPEEIYQRLKADAARNGRSLNRETIAQLQASFQSPTSNRERRESDQRDE